MKAVLPLAVALALAPVQLVWSQAAAPASPPPVATSPSPCRFLGNCNDPHGWAAIEIDPDTLKAEPYIKVAGSAAFDDGAALAVGKDLYIGADRGDRVAVIPAP